MANTTVASDGGTSAQTFQNAIAGPYWSDTLTGVIFYYNSGDDLAMARTTDGGANWTTSTIETATSVRPFAFNYAADRAGDTGSTVYMAWYNSSTNRISFRTYSISADTLGSEVEIAAGAGIGGSIASIFISCAQNGDIGVGWVSDTFNIGTFYLSTNSGASFTSTGNTPWETFADDIAMGVWCQTPTSSDHAIVFYDISAGELSVKVYNSGSWTETSIVTGLTTSIGGTYQSVPFDCALRRSDGHVLVVTHSEQDTANDDITCYDLNINSVAAPTVTTKTAIITNTTNYANVSLCIDYGTDDVYVAVTTDAGDTTNALTKYFKSTDGMATWGAAQSYSEGAANQRDARYIGQTRSHPDGGRFQPVFYVNSASDLFVNLVNDVEFTALSVTVVLTGTMPSTTTEDGVAAGGLTIIATVTGTTWHADIDNDDTESEDWIASLVSAGAEALGWNNVVVGKFYRREVLNDSPLSYFRGTYNAWTDLGSVANNGTPTGLTQGAALLLSSAQRSSVFNAGAAKVALSSPAGLDNLWDGGGTVEMVIRPWASGFSLDQSKLVSKIDGGAGWELILDNQSGGYCDISLRVDFSTMQGVWKVAGRVPIGLQTHVAVTFDADSSSNDPTFYINGQPLTPVEETTPSGTRTTDASSNIFLGSNSSVAVTYNGEMQEVAFYATSLSATRIQAHVLAASNRYGLRYSDLARTSATVITLTMPVFPFFDITQSEVVTATFPTDVFATPPADAVVATPTITITSTTRKTGFVPPANVFANQTPGPFGNVNGGLGPAAGAAFRVLGAGDEWITGIRQLAIGLGGSTNPRVLMIRATEITEIDEA